MGGRFAGKEGFLIQGVEAAGSTLRLNVLPALAERGISGEEITPMEARMIHITWPEKRLRTSEPVLTIQHSTTNDFIRKSSDPRSVFGQDAPFDPKCTEPQSFKGPVWDRLRALHQETPDEASSEDEHNQSERVKPKRGGLSL